MIQTYMYVVPSSSSSLNLLSLPKKRELCHDWRGGQQMNSATIIVKSKPSPAWKMDQARLLLLLQLHNRRLKPRQNTDYFYPKSNVRQTKRCWIWGFVICCQSFAFQTHYFECFILANEAFMQHHFHFSYSYASSFLGLEIGMQLASKNALP